MTNLVVRPHQPWRVRLFTALALAMAVASGWGMFEYGRYRGGFDFLEAKAARTELLQSLAEQEQTIRRLREGQVVLERTREVEREAYGQLEGTVAALQDEILELKEELAFYRGIVSPNDRSEGLRLQDFELVPGLAERTWRYKLVLTQVLKNDTVATGHVALTVLGTQNGEPKQLELKDIVTDGKGEPAFRFKYFQDLHGEFALPAEFVPAAVKVVVDPRGRKRPRLEESFDWPAEES